ncbi:hypothetical protein [Methanoculleus sp.]|jgi:starch phosphorylase|uniref:hypothetical protein n=1 Tax=Methanoculleus sp. TaxID=90427 RepID=UPI001BD62499|nr:hypothetical protein [Methanoculleus sp.]
MVDCLCKVIPPRAGEGEDHLRRTLCDSELPAVGAPDRGLGVFHHGVEGLKAGDGEGAELFFEGLPFLRFDDRNVDGVPILYSKLEYLIIPTYYLRKDEWATIMRSSIAKIVYYLNTHRMMRRYATEAYL